jgi:hypothetical protein
MHRKPQETLKEATSKTIIGWSEYVGFPQWGIDRLPAKVDTGALTSSLHVDDLEVLDDHRVRFKVVLSRKHRHKRVQVTAKVLKWGRVRSSTGHYHTRCFVKTRIRIGPVEKEIELSLASREQMLYRMLLGRKALDKDFLVDVSRRRALGKPQKTKRKTARVP